MVIFRVNLLLLMAVLLHMCHVRADYDCMCNYKVETTVYRTPSEQGTPIGSLYEFDCKPIHGPIVKGFSEIEYEHKIAYVKVEDDVTDQVCPGDIPDSDKVPTTAVPAKSPETTPVTTTTTVATTANTESPSDTPSPTTPSTTTPLPTSTTVATTSTSTPKPSSTSSSTPTPTTTASTTTQRPTSTTVATTVTTTSSTSSSTPTPMTTSTTTTTFSPAPRSIQPTSSKTTNATPQATEKPEITMTATLSTTPITNAATAAPKAAACPASVTNSFHNWKYTIFNGNCYQVDEPFETFDHAESACRSRGGHLMHIRSAAEQDFITKFLQSNYNHEVWIGLGDHQNEEIWTWTSGVPLSYTHWDPHRKDFFLHGFEDCVVLEPGNHGYWDDRQCSGFLIAKHSYVCQYDAHAPVIIG